MAYTKGGMDKKKKILIVVALLVIVPVILYKAVPQFKSWVDENIISKIKKK